MTLMGVRVRSKYAKSFVASIARLLMSGIEIVRQRSSAAIYDSVSYRGGTFCYERAMIS